MSLEDLITYLRKDPALKKFKAGAEEFDYSVKPNHLQDPVSEMLRGAKFVENKKK